MESASASALRCVENASLEDLVSVCSGAQWVDSRPSGRKRVPRSKLEKTPDVISVFLPAPKHAYVPRSDGMAKDGGSYFKDRF